MIITKVHSEYPLCRWHKPIFYWYSWQHRVDISPSFIFLFCFVGLCFCCSLETWISCSRLMLPCWDPHANVCNVTVWLKHYFGWWEDWPHVCSIQYGLASWQQISCPCPEANSFCFEQHNYMMLQLPVLTTTILTAVLQVLMGITVGMQVQSGTWKSGNLKNMSQHECWIWWCQQQWFCQRSHWKTGLKILQERKAKCALESEKKELGFSYLFFMQMHWEAVRTWTNKNLKVKNLPKCSKEMFAAYLGLETGMSFWQGTIALRVIGVTDTFLGMRCSSWQCLEIHFQNIRANLTLHIPDLYSHDIASKIHCGNWGLRWSLSWRIQQLWQFQLVQVH